VIGVDVLKELTYFKCRRCGMVQLPRARCIRCKGKDFDEYHPDVESGRLISFTILRALPGRRRGRGECAFGIVEFGGGVRGFGQLRGENLRVGMRVKPVVDVVADDDGKPVYGVVFVPREDPA